MALKTYEITPEHILSAPVRGFSVRSALEAGIREWYESPASAVEMRLGEKDDSDRDGSDAQLRDSLCKMAGMRREKTPRMENGVQVRSEKRDRPVFDVTPFSTGNRLDALSLLGLEERELSRIGKSRIVSLVKVSGETVPLASDEDEDEFDEDQDN